MIIMSILQRMLGAALQMSEGIKTGGSVTRLPRSNICMENSRRWRKCLWTDAGVDHPKGSIIGGPVAGHWVVLCCRIVVHARPYTVGVYESGSVVSNGDGNHLASNSNTNIAMLSKCLLTVKFIPIAARSYVSVNGGNVASLATGLISPWDVAVDGANAYWVENFSGGAVKQAPLGGGAIITLSSGLNEPVAIAIDSTNVYWIERNGGGSAGTVKMIAKGISTPAACYDPMVPLTVGASAMSDSICQGYYQQYSFPILSGNIYKVTITPSAGDPDLYSWHDAVSTYLYL